MASDDEEENCIRLFMLLTSVAPKAVRNLFDRKLPPTDLQRLLQNNKSTLTKLKLTRVINQSQWDLIYPPSVQQIPQSNQFDVTLMICLLRNLKLVNEPPGGFERQPGKMDHSEGADLARIKYHRNKMAHKNDYDVGRSEFETAWLELSDAINRLTNGAMKEECDRLKVKGLDKNIEKIRDDMNTFKENMGVLKDDMNTFKENMDDIKEDIKHVKRFLQNDVHTTTWRSQFIDLERQSMSQPKIQDIDPNTYEQWVKDDEIFVKTKAVQYILQKLEKKSIITVTGVSGIGKTTVLHHVALRYKRKGYTIVPIKSPLEIISQFERNMPMIFVMDDTCGESLINMNVVGMWLQHEGKINMMLSNKRIKIIASSLLYIFNEKQFQRITLLKSCTCNLSDKRFVRKFEENVNILANHLPNTDFFQTIQGFHQNDFTAILPFTSLLRNSRNSSNEIHTWITDQQTYFSGKMDEISADKEKICTLFLLLVTNGCIGDAYFRCDQNYEFQQNLDSIFEEFGLNRGTPKRFIEDNLEVFKDTYVKKIGQDYFPINNSIFIELCLYFCKNMLERVIKYADSKLISQRLNLELLHQSRETAAVIVNIPKELETTFFDRITRDMMHGDICNAFSSQQMANPFYRLKLKRHIMKLDFPSRKKLLNKKDREEKDTSLLYLVCELGYIDFVLLILDYVDDINAYSHFLPLNAACSNGFMNIVKLLIKNGADVTKYDDKGCNGLLEACKRGYVDIAKLMLKIKADVKEKNIKGFTALMVACGNGQTEIVKLLLCQNTQSKFLNEYSKLGGTSLFIACLYNCIDIVDILLSYKADPNISTFNKWTPLMVACQNNNPKMVSLLIANGALVNVSTVSKTTPLIVACGHGYSDIAIKLIQNSAKLDTSDQFGITALHASCYNGHLHTTELLLEQGIDINETDSNGFSPLAIAARNSHKTIVEVLLKKGAKINIDKINLRSTVSEACLGGDQSIVKLLIDKGSEINYQSCNELTPLMAACFAGNKDIAQYLIQRGAKTNERDGRGWTALFSASSWNNTEVVKLLLENHALINVENYLGLSPLMCASFYENIGVVGLLRQCGANWTTTNKFGYSILSVVSRTGSESFLNWIINELLGTSMINQTDKSGCSPLMHACSVGHLDKANLLIKKGADINIRDISGWTCLMWASEQGNEMLVDMLINKGQYINDVDNNGCSALSIASYIGHLDVIEILLLNGACTNLCDKNSWTPLMWACRGKHVNSVKLLLDYDADINIQSDDNKTPLQWACETGEDNIVDILIAQYLTIIGDCKINLWVLLMWAARHGKTDIAHECMLQGVNVNKADNDGMTPLIVSTYNAHFEIVKLLISNNANVSQLDYQGWSALRWAAQLSFHDIFIYLLLSGACITGADWLPMILWSSKKRSGYNKLLNTFIKQGVDLNCVDNKGCSPLFLSCIADNYDKVLSLIEIGVDSNKSDDRKRTPLMIICRVGNVEIFKLLIEYDVDIFQIDDKGNTCLIEAVKGGHKSIVADLIQKGSNKDTANKRFWTAREEARWRGYTDIVKIVES